MDTIPNSPLLDKPKWSERFVTAAMVSIGAMGGIILLFVSLFTRAGLLAKATFTFPEFWAITVFTAFMAICSGVTAFPFAFGITIIPRKRGGLRMLRNILIICLLLLGLCAGLFGTPDPDSFTL
jgi:hypothetical protein